MHQGRKSLVLLSSFILCNLSAQQLKPNIVLIVADDAGYADFGFQGSAEFQTPNIDKIAQHGVKFTQGYVSSSVSSPSRAGILTGRYQERFGHENNLPEQPLYGATPEISGLNVHELTLADVLKAQGYSTAAIGKWHLGSHENFHPLNRGFDYFFGFLGGSRSYWDTEEIDVRKLYRNRISVPFTGYITDILAEDAVNYIETNKSKPFFLYLAFSAVHEPVEAKPELISKFNNIKSEGRRKLAAMTYSLDESIGKVMDELSKNKMLENTIIFFLSDNGGPTDQNFSCNGILSGTKGSKKEGGIRVPFLMQWKGKIAENSVYNNPIISLDIFKTITETIGMKSDSLLKLDGVNLLPYISGKNMSRPHQRLYWRRGSYAAIRDVDWKLIRYPNRLPELYDMKNDFSETRNMADIHKPIVQKMLNELFEWECQMNPPSWQENAKWMKNNLKHFDNFPANHQ